MDESMLERLLEKYYGIKINDIKRASVGAGSDTFFVSDGCSRYVVKFPCESEINKPEGEAALCTYLLNKGLPVSEFLKNSDGEYLSVDENSHKFHVQKFIEGKMYELNTAPSWLLRESACMLGRIHTALSEYKSLSAGIGCDFFRFMTPENALDSYKSSMTEAQRLGDTQIESELLYRESLMKKFPRYTFDLNRLSLKNTHGDYFLSQLLCGDDRINAVIDWTTACVHPAVWEIMRSYVYAASECAYGEIDTDKFIEYVKVYMEYSSLNTYDLEIMPKLFYYQIAVCDYYGQYYGSNAENRDIYLHQARFSTGLMRWFEHNADMLSDRLVQAFK